MLSPECRVPRKIESQMESRVLCSTRSKKQTNKQTGAVKENKRYRGKLMLRR